MKKLNDFPSRTEKVVIKQLGVDETYQRPVSKAKVNKIVKNFNPIGMGPILVSEREDGSLWIFDGQHRIEALKILGELVWEVTIYSGMTLKDEATAFRLLQEGSKANAAERYVSELAAGVKETIAIENLLNQNGFTVNRGSSKYTIQAADTVKEIYRKYGPKNLKDTVCLIRDSLGTQQKNYIAVILLGVSEFIKQYPEHDRKWIVRKLNEEGLNSFKYKIADYHRSTGKTKKVATVKTLVRIYNHNKTKRLQLED
ncbi:uncharacterized protein DUF6551 [Staphylococcus epidermidis]|jgi:ORF017|uniref:DUF6551 family protein n=1 Tax=Staphylococcus epidermidis TaxID=1282 RepID=UPI00138B1425|nr:DUF6551 family protein [Staphylococcus epidermidis]MBC2966018.1 hypothetical protein [Staphylococcus epidermidis]MBC3110181.1 hypothetical protein [Staphylococcus epidermidis]MBC3168400.1 hypothetical protein [Staphylococcus epidermidis]MBM0792683.1 hypothetical protein [Staphylococcus epidermidis]MBM0831617.1 hypothetical protein [Staphylococcus epidermidis]